jgi:hypothetical protein
MSGLLCLSSLSTLFGSLAAITIATAGLVTIPNSFCPFSAGFLLGFTVEFRILGFLRIMVWVHTKAFIAVVLFASCLLLASSYTDPGVSIGKSMG